MKKKKERKKKEKKGKKFFSAAVVEFPTYVISYLLIINPKTYVEVYELLSLLILCFEHQNIFNKPSAIP
jgi:hypothetical protein